MVISIPDEVCTESVEKYLMSKGFKLQGVGCGSTEYEHSKMTKATFMKKLGPTLKRKYGEEFAKTVECYKS